MTSSKTKSKSTRKNNKVARVSRSNPFVRYNTGPFKPRFNCKLRYMENVTIADKGAASTTFGAPLNFALNGLFDPDITGVGHQPLYYDQITPLYNRYKVTQCDVDLEIVDPTVDSLCVGATILNPDNLAFTMTSFNGAQMREYPLSIVKYLADSGTLKTRIKYSVPMHKAFNWKKKLFEADVDGSTGPVTANPATLAYLQFAVANLRGGTAASVVVRVNLTYHCQFYDRKMVAAS